MSQGFVSVGPGGLDELGKAGKACADTAAALSGILRGFQAGAAPDVDTYDLIEEGAAEFAKGYEAFLNGLSSALWQRETIMRQLGEGLRAGAVSYDAADSGQAGAPPVVQAVEPPSPGTVSIIWNATLDMLGMGGAYEERLAQMRESCLATAESLRSIHDTHVSAIEAHVQRADWRGDAADAFRETWRTRVNPPEGNAETPSLAALAARGDEAAAIVDNAIKATQETKKYVTLLMASLGVAVGAGAALSLGARAINRLAARQALGRVALLLSGRHAKLGAMLVRVAEKLAFRSGTRLLGAKEAGRAALSAYAKNSALVAGTNYVNSSLANTLRGKEDPWGVNVKMAGTLAGLSVLGGGVGFVKGLAPVARLAQNHPMAFAVGLEGALNAGASTGLSLLYDGKPLGAALKDGLTVGAVSAIFGGGYARLLRDRTGLRHHAFHKADKWDLKLSAADPSKPLTPMNARFTPRHLFSWMDPAKHGYVPVVGRGAGDPATVWAPKNSVSARAREFQLWNPQPALNKISTWPRAVQAPAQGLLNFSSKPVSAFLDGSPFVKGRLLGLLPGTISYSLVPRGQVDTPALSVPEHDDWTSGAPAPQPEQAVPETPPTLGGGERVVAPGDTLGHIAVDEYGDPRHARTVYEANDDIDGITPDHIEPGWRLDIPEIPTGERPSGP
ncbi:hypothetical protein ABGB14_03105 [Nonomuraea sp. B10E15]|uniref:LysM peptidoglycan-binding domain-containing protein n=1 Tax=Nonomuraea sp. B10E15 TaxID=3153560 RepID=UPI00325F83D3